MFFLDELKRRNVIRVGLAYLAVAWLILQVAELLLPVYGFTGAVIRNLVAILAIGLVVTVVLAWVFQWTPAGIIRETDDAPPPDAGGGKHFDRFIVVALVAALSFFVFDKFVLDPARDRAAAEEARQEGRDEAIADVYGDKSIAVLPFINMSADHDQEYFSDGFTEELLNLLAQVGGLRVTSRSSSFYFKDKDIVVPEVAAKLNVAYLLEGSVRRAGEEIRVTAQLIDARNDRHVWSQTYDRDFTGVFAIQDDIAKKVVEDLKIELFGAMPTVEEIDPRAYDLLLRARRLLHSDFDVDKEREAVNLLEKALEFEPAWVTAHAELLRAYLRLRNQLPDQRELYESKSWAQLDRLFAADERGDRASSWRGWLRWVLQGDIQAAADGLANASHFDPKDIDRLRGITVVMNNLGRYDEALAISEYLLERDPACVPCIYNLAGALRNLGRHREAAQKLESVLEWYPEPSRIAWPVGVSWLVAGEPAKALEYFNTDGSNLELGRLLALHDLGRAEEFEQDFSTYRDANQDNPEGIARIYAWTGNNDEAFRWLERMVELYGAAGAGDVRTDLYAKLKDDPRWLPFLERHGQASDALGKVTFEPQLPPEVEAAIRNSRHEST